MDPSTRNADLAATVLDWYTVNGRDLAFRRASDPWAILVSEAPARFASTSRWLRGRIVDRLRDAPDGAWVTFTEPMGEHGAAAIRAAVEGLARDGLVEREPGVPASCRIRATPDQRVSATGSS